MLTKDRTQFLREMLLGRAELVAALAVWQRTLAGA